MKKNDEDKLLRNREYVKLYLIENVGRGIINDLLLYLLKFVNSKNNELDLTPYKKKFICQKLNISEHAIYVYLNRLEKNGFLARKGTGTYAVNPYRAMRAGVKFFEKAYADYLEAQRLSERTRKKNNIKYRLNQNRGKKELPENIISLSKAQ